MGFSGAGIAGGILDDNGLPSSLAANSEHHLEVAIHEPRGAFGEVVTAQLQPKSQIDAIYGILSTDHETFTSGTSSHASSSLSMFSVGTGTNVGGYGVIRSHRLTRYRPGQGARFRFTAMFPSSASLGLCMAGAFNSEDALFVGYSGTTFGMLRRIAGAAHIARLTISAGSSAPETITLTLDGINYSIIASGALGTVAISQLLADNVPGYPPWNHSTSPTHNDSTVTFIQGTPGSVTGSFGITSTGTVSGSFTTLQVGAPNDSTTGFIAKTAWNMDRMDGTANAYNPSGLLLDTTKLNVYEIVYPYLGAGAPVLRIMASDGEFKPVHVIRYPNNSTKPNQKNPSFRVGWIAASLGSTTNLEVKGASAAGFVEGLYNSSRDPFSALNPSGSFTTAEQCALVIRNRGELNGVLNFREIYPETFMLGNETANRLLRAKVYVNPTISGSINWIYTDQTSSAAEYALPTTAVLSGGRLVATTFAATQASINLKDLALRLSPGDTMAIGVSTVSGGSTGIVGVNWQEE